MKKKLLIGVLAFAMCLTLVGCGKTENKNNNNSNNNKEENTNNETSSSSGTGEYTYFDGKLTQIVDENGNPKQKDFVIDGIILVGNRHSYSDIADTEAVVPKLVSQGYKKEGLYIDFYLNEWIEMYIDTKYSKSEEDVKILITPHRTVEELEKLSYAELEQLVIENGGAFIDYGKPQEDNYKFVGSGYVNADFPEGEYDILFTYKGKLAYFININETKEP